MFSNAVQLRTQQVSVVVSVLCRRDREYVNANKTATVIQNYCFPLRRAGRPERNLQRFQPRFDRSAATGPSVSARRLERLV